MAGIPVTRTEVGEARAEAVRDAVRAVSAAPGGSRPAREADAEALFEFLSDPAVHAPIYTLPRPLTLEAVRAFIADHAVQQAAGEGLLCVTLAPGGEVLSYSDFQVWPRWAAGELGGGMRADRQSRGEGASGAARSFAWMFDALGLDLICETAAPDNVRTARLLDGLGFRRMGEVESVRPDGTVRRSLVWEITAAEWRAR